MIERPTLLLWLGFAAGVLLIGIPFWLLPYNANVFGNPGIHAGLGGLALVTAVLAFAGVPAGRLFWAMAGAFPAAYALRVVVDVARDPTSHNLWPIGMVMIAVYSLVAVVPGLIVGLLLRRLRAQQ